MTQIPLFQLRTKNKNLILDLTKGFTFIFYINIQFKKIKTKQSKASKKMCHIILNRGIETRHQHQ